MRARIADITAARRARAVCLAPVARGTAARCAGLLGAPAAGVTLALAVPIAIVAAVGLVTIGRRAHAVVAKATRAGAAVVLHLRVANAGIAVTARDDALGVAHAPGFAVAATVRAACLADGAGISVVASMPLRCRFVRRTCCGSSAAHLRRVAVVDRRSAGG